MSHITYRFCVDGGPISSESGEGNSARIQDINGAMFAKYLSQLGEQSIDVLGLSQGGEFQKRYQLAERLALEGIPAVLR